MPHIHVASSTSLLITIFIFCIVFIFIILIPFGNGSYSKYELSDNIYKNDDPDSFSFFAECYRNEMKIKKEGIIPKVNQGVLDTIVTCSYKEIQSSENKSCGNLTGLYNTELMIEKIKKIDKFSNIIWPILIGLFLIQGLITVSVYKLIFPSTSLKINQEEFEFKYKKRRLLFKYFRILFIPILIPICYLVTYYSSFNTFFTNINGVSSKNGDSFGFCIVAIVFSCMGTTLIILSTVIYLTRKNSSSSSNNNSYKTPNGESIPLKNHL